MEKIIIPDHEKIEDEATAWLIRLDGDSPLNASEERELDEWLARSPVHRETLKNLNTFWANANVLGELAEPGNLVDIARKRLLSYFQPITTMGSPAVFASVLVLALGAFTLGLFDFKNITDTNGLYVTAVGQQKTVTLVDDSIIELNTNSQVQVDYSEGFRNIRLLQGEAHFEVAKDASKPFRVYAGSGRVQAVGTAFNVYLKNNNIDVFVTEGRVAVASILPLDNQPQTDKTTALAQAEVSNSHDRDAYVETRVNGLGEISAGQGALLKDADTPASGAADNTPIKLIPIADNNQKELKQLAWRQGLIVFSGESLETVIEEISRYTPVHIEIVNPDLRNIAIGGQVEVGDTDSMFKALETNFGLTIKRISYNHVQVIAANP